MASAALAKILAPATSTSIDEPKRAALGSEDSDRDGVIDADDRCPVTPEDLDGFEDEDGCPEADNDDDGIADGVDRCADAAETINGWKDEDGCPDEHEDVDGDGVEYEADRCPCGGRRSIRAVHSTRKQAEARLIELGAGSPLACCRPSLSQ